MFGRRMQDKLDAMNWRLESLEAYKRAEVKQTLARGGMRSFVNGLDVPDNIKELIMREFEKQLYRWTYDYSTY